MFSTGDGAQLSGGVTAREGPDGKAGGVADVGADGGGLGGVVVAARVSRK